MCEALLKREFTNSPNERFTVMSAGLHAIPGTPAHPWSIIAARELGISLEDHRARLLTAEMIHKADAIFAMDYYNHVQILSGWPDAKGRVFLLGAYSNTTSSGVEISDPYDVDLEATRRCYEILSDCVRSLAEALLPARRTSAVDEKFRDSPAHS
jgi:protein-tyrosine phosphatase